ncbi:MAG: polysaccharide biosynthesis/export family protein [Desulfobulbaceae bacterium]
MKRGKIKYSVQALLLLALIIFVAPFCQSAESTADVSVDAAQKEKMRQQSLGQSVSDLVDEEYVIGYRDILNVSVYGEGSMAVSEGIQSETAASDASNAPAGGANFVRGRGTGIEVRNDGRASLRHIGDVSVVGMTLTQLANYLKQLYSTIYDNPSLTVTLVQSNSKQYTVMGQVVNPGLYHLDFPLDIVNAIARAGGFTEWAKSEITVIRQKSANKADEKAKEGKGETFKFDYDDFLKGRNIEKNITIKSGDVIVVH